MKFVRIAIIFLFLLPISCVAFAGTVYRDRFIPGGTCMVEFEGRSINAALIEEVSVNTFTEYVRVEAWFGLSRMVERSFKGLRVFMVNRDAYYKRSDNQAELEASKARFLVQIKKKCK